MNRRDFLKLAGVTGLSVSAPFAFAKNLSAQSSSDPYPGPFFLLVNAGGGWDPTSLGYPNGRTDENMDRPVNKYFTGDIETVVNYQVAPIPGHR